jgi:hypothetical protein
VVGVATKTISLISGLAELSPYLAVAGFALSLVSAFLPNDNTVILNDLSMI